MPVDERMRVQIELILDNLDDAAAYPAPDQWSQPQVNDIDYLYREYAILTREPDADRVEHAATRILSEAGYEGNERRIRRESVSAGVVRFTIPREALLVPAFLDLLDDDLGPGVATPDHILFVCPYSCPATEPDPPPPGSQASPQADPIVAELRTRPETGHAGQAASVVVVDTGLITHAAASHPWLDGVRGGHEDTYTTLDGQVVIAPYAGHGTFVAGVTRRVAPGASVYVEKAFIKAGADYETSLLQSLERAFSRNPDVFVWPFTTSTRRDLAPLTFDDLFARRARQLQGLVMLAAVGNDGAQRPMWPAACPQVISVGALAANGRERAPFSDYGEWVDVYAPGQGLINAFPVGTYVYREPPLRGKSAQFHGLAQWSGTSFAVPIVAGLIAARMSATRENARQAADALLKLAHGQAIPGVGPVLYPGQALLDGAGG